MFDKIYLIGNGRVADDCLRILAKRQDPVEYIEVFAEKFTFTEKLCERLKIKLRRFDKNEIREFLLNIEERTLIISAHNSYIFPPEVCMKDNITIINLHIAYLPEYRGMNPTTWAIYNQEAYAGVTWHTVSSKIDNGKIITQKKVPITEDDTAMSLMLRCFKEGIILFEEHIDSFISDSFSTFVPENSNTRLYLSKELPNDGYIDNSWDFAKTYAFLRSMDYSGANLMRLPRVVNNNGKIYEITKYIKTSAENCEGFRHEKWADNKLDISWGGCCLSCTLREVADTDLSNHS